MITVTEMITLKGKYTTADIMTDMVEDNCISTIQKLTNHPVFTNPIRVMPDVHEGKGSVIGFTMKMTDKVIPSTIGVDLGCGVTTKCIGNVGIDFERLDVAIRKNVPLGFATNSKPKVNIERGFDWGVINSTASKFRDAYTDLNGLDIQPVTYTYTWFLDLCKKIKANPVEVGCALGSLGGGNHFLEVAEGKTGYWVVVHSGSRNFGLRIATYYQNLAEDRFNQSNTSVYADSLAALKEKYTGVELGAKINALKDECSLGVPKDLAYLTGQDAHDYLHAMIFAQYYAKTNRDTMINTIISVIPGAHVTTTIESVHNFIDFNDLTIRKGAIRSYEGEPLIIPFNMRDGSIIGTGKSNPDWNYSAPHGAGRVMSRSQAKKLLSLNVFRNTMTGIYSTSIGEGTLDESPDAYKDYRVIQEAVEPTVHIDELINPVYNLKAG
jgi:tRNA-splicing ligase RtcB